MFLSPDSNKWDPYDDTYALNEDSFLVSRWYVVMRGPTVKRTLVDEVYLAAVEANGYEEI